MKSRTPWGYDVLVFGLFDRLGIGSAKRREAKARKLELAGDLEGAAALYVDAERPEEAARVLLLRADAEADPEKRMVICAQAARVGEGTEVGTEARRRKARLSFDLVRGTAGGAMHGELSRVGAELEEVGEWQAAAEAYALAGDQEAEIRVLKEAGDIDRLEARLREGTEKARKERDREHLLRNLRDMDAIAERRRALAAAEAWLERADDEQVELEVDRIRSRLLAGPDLTLEVWGVRQRFVLGSELTIGRAHADIVVPSSAISRQHLRLYREDGVAMIEDLGTRNGTILAGAKITGGLPIGEGLSLDLAGRVPCRVEPLSLRRAGGGSPESKRRGGIDTAVLLEIGGAAYVCPLGPLVVGEWRITDAHDGDTRFVVLRTPKGGQPPIMGSYRLAHEIELCLGDELHEERGGDVVLSVPRDGQAMAPPPLRSHPGGAW